MKIIDKTPLQNEKGEIGSLQRLQGTLEHGLQWYPELEAQKAVITQLELVLEKGFTLIRNVTLGSSPIVEPLILIGPPGVYVIHVTPLSGFYEAKGDQWNQVKSGRPYPASTNLMQRVARLARALQVFLERQGVTLPGPVEPVLMASSPAMHIDSLRPMVRVVLSDAVRQFAASLLQARPVLRPEFTYEIADRIITPRPKAPPPEPEEVKTPEYIPPSLRDQEQEEEETPSRARAIFHAAEEAKPFDPADLDFAFDENAETAEAEVPPELKEPSPSQRLPPVRTGAAFSSRQWILLGGMAIVECCVLAAFAYAIVSNLR
ncbi:MAG: NERD domain-containing protein [Anaerolineae bacterium]